MRYVYVASVLTATFCVSCQTYQPLRIDDDAHRAAWAERDPARESVRTFLDDFVERGGGPPQTYNPADGLDLAEAEVVALFFNASLRAKRLEAGISLAGSRESGLWEDPTLSVDAASVLQSVSHPWILSASVGLTLPISGRLDLEQNKAFAEHQRDRAEVVRAEWETLCALRSEWFALEAIAKRQSINSAHMQSLDQITRVAEELHRAGEVNGSELRVFQLERLQARLEELTLAREHSAGRLMILGLLGLRPDVPIILRTALIAEDVGVGDAIAVATARNPSLAVYRAAFDDADQSLRLEIRKQYPDLSIASGFAFEDGESRVLSAFGIPIPLFNLNRRGIAEAQARRLAAKAAYENEYETLESAVTITGVRLAQAREQRRIIEEEYLPLADAQIKDTQALAKLGDFDALLQLDAILRQRDARHLVLATMLQEARANLELRRLLGPTWTPSEMLPPQR